MESRLRPLLLRYGLAVGCVLLATWLRMLFHPDLGAPIPFATYYLALFVVAWYGGWGPALLCLVLSVLAASRYFVPPPESLFPTDVPGWVALGLFAAVGVSIVLLSEWSRRGTEQVQQARERFFVTLSSIGDGVIVTDREARITFMNPVAEQLTGWIPAEAQGKPLEDVFPIVNERTRQPTENPVRRALREGRIVGLANHTVLIAKDGTERAIDDSAAPVRDRKGQVLGVVLVFRDVSRERAAQVARARLAALVGSSEEAIIGQSLEGVLTDWNTGAEQIFGFSAEETVGKPSSATIVPPDRKQELFDVLKRIGQGERIEPFETVRLSKDGRRIPVSIRVSPICDDEGRVVGASAIDRDISRQQAAERRRNARLAITQILAREKNIEKAIADILAAVCTPLQWDVGCFWRIQPEQEGLRCHELWQNPARQSDEFCTATLQLLFGHDESLPGRVWESRQPVWVADVTADPHFARASQAQSCGLHGALACPVSVGDDFLGVVEFFSYEIRQPDEELLEMMTTIGGQLGQFIERSQAEQDLERSERELSDFFENASVGLHWVGPDGTILRVNQAELDLLGYTREEYVGRHIAEFHVDQPVIEEILQCLAAGEQLHDCEARLRCKDGSIKDVLIDSNVLWEDGQFIHTRCFTRDITERKRIERSLKFLAEASKSLASLVDYRSTLQQIVHLAVPDYADWCAADMLEADGSVHRLAVAHVDPAKVELAEELFQRYPPAPDAPRGVMNVLRTGQPELGAPISDLVLQQAAQDEEHLRVLRGLAPRSYICVPLAAKGKTFGVLSFVSAESGRLYGPDDLAMAAELAHRAAIAIENARLYNELRETERRKDEFLAMLAHELRNPLAPIRSGLDILAMEEHGQHEETVRLMQDQVEHMVRLVDDLLDVSRIMRGRVELRQEPVELATLVKRSVDAVRPLVEDRQQTLSVSMPEQPVWLNADPVRLVQVIENLLNNASKYTDAGGLIELVTESRDGEAAISLRDTGIGIEPELLPDVFELFTQSSRSLDRAQGGLGIGLTLVQRLVEMHGGTVSAHSEGPGHGSTFSVRLPVIEAAAPEEKPIDEEPRSIRSRRILVVDDNVGAASMLSNLLMKLGDHEVQTAYGGASALGIVQEIHPEIVFLDIGLPGMDGYQVARAIREIPERNGVLLVALTGYGQEEDRRRSEAAGFDEHLVKPPSVDQLKAILGHPKLSTT